MYHLISCYVLEEWVVTTFPYSLKKEKWEYLVAHHIIKLLLVNASSELGVTTLHCYSYAGHP
jgi:hypothetical protein